MSEQPKGGGGVPPDDAVPEAPGLDVPPTRKSPALPPTDPPVRESHLELAPAPETFPDDGRLAATLRAIDTYVGLAELAVLIAIFVAVVLVASLSALAGHLAHHQIGLWWNFVVRKGTFAIAMLGAAFATQQRRLLAMDLISRRLAPRGRLVLSVALALFTIAVSGVLVYISLYMHDHADSGGPQLDLGAFALTEKQVIMVLPIGAGLIMFHSLVHALIDGEYLVRNKLPPERARSGH